MTAPKCFGPVTAKSACIIVRYRRFLFEYQVEAFFLFDIPSFILVVTEYVIQEIIMLTIPVLHSSHC
jgi:hypothetical protein